MSARAAVNKYNPISYFCISAARLHGTTSQAKTGYGICSYCMSQYGQYTLAGLLQCTVEWRTGGNFWQTTALPEQPDQSRLPEPVSHRRQAAASLATLASGEAAGHL